MKPMVILTLATFAACQAHAEDLTFVATGQVTFVTQGGETLGGRFDHAVTKGDEVRFFYTFDPSTPYRVVGSQFQRRIYGDESRTPPITAINKARVEVAGNIWEFVPCGAPMYCSARVEIYDDLFAASNYYDAYQVNAVDLYEGVVHQVLMTLSTTAASAPTSLTSLDLPVTPPDPAIFLSRGLTLTRASPPYTIAVGEVTSLQLVPPDSIPPTVTGLFALANPVAVGLDTKLTATASDAGSGDSNLAAAEYSVDGGPYQAMLAADGSFDAMTEVIEANLSTSSWSPGVYDVCVRATDQYDHTSEPNNDTVNSCTLIVVYDPSGGFVTGGGWFYSSAGSCFVDSGCAEIAGKANFGFVSRYKRGATTPTGITQFQFSAGGISFHSQNYEWLVVNTNGGTAQFKGSGTINDVLSPSGEAYKFMLWAEDGGGEKVDTLRIKIWYVDAGSEVLVYDNAFGQVIGGGSIVVHE